MIYFLIPVFNEELNLQIFLKDLIAKVKTLKQNAEVIIVNDGSYDRSFEIIKNLANENMFKIFNHPTNLGVDRAFKTGFEYLFNVADEGDILITLEGDGTSDLNLIPQMISHLEDGADVVLAGCYAPGGRVIGDPPLRLFTSIAANYLLKLLFPIQGVHTYTSFFRAMRIKFLFNLKKAFKKRYFEGKGFSCMADMLVKIRRLKPKIKEIPFVLKSREDIAQSKLKIFPTFMAYLRLFFRNTFKAPKFSK